MIVQILLLVVTLALAAGATGLMYTLFGTLGAALTVAFSAIAAGIALYLTGALSGGSADPSTSYESKGAREE